MTLSIAVAEKFLRHRFEDPAKPLPQYIIGFRTATVRDLGLHQETNETRIWFEQPAPPALEGVALMTISTKNSNLDGPLSPLNATSNLS